MSPGIGKGFQGLSSTFPTQKFLKYPPGHCHNLSLIVSGLGNKTQNKMPLPFLKDELSMPDSSIRGIARWRCLLYRAATKHWKAFGPLLGIISTNSSARSPLVRWPLTASLSSSSRHSDRSFNTFKGSKSLIRSARCLWIIFLCSSDMPAILTRYKYAEAMSFTWFYRAASHILTFVVLYSNTSLPRQIYTLFFPFSLQICTNKSVLKSKAEVQ